MHSALNQSQDIDRLRALSSRQADTGFVTLVGSDHHIHIEVPNQWVEEVATFVGSLAPRSLRSTIRCYPSSLHYCRQYYRKGFGTCPSSYASATRANDDKLQKISGFKKGGRSHIPK